MSDDKTKSHPLYDTPKSWKEAHKRADSIMVKAKEAEKAWITATQKTEEVMEDLRQLYPIIPKTDGTNFGVSPMSPFLITELAMEIIFRTEKSRELWLSKRIVRRKLIDLSKPYSFTETVKRDVLGWVFKLEKSDLDKIT